MSWLPLERTGFLRIRKTDGGRVLPVVTPPRMAVALVEAEPAEYVDARTEARNLCRNLGLDVENEHWDTASVSDFVRLAYAQGWIGCESRISAPDMADDIAQALDDPGSILDRNSNESVARWSVRAVQHVVAHGKPEEPKS